MIKAAVVGATGYTGEELIKILIRHPDVKITDISRHSVEKKELISDIFPEFKSRIDLECKKIDAARISGNADVIFLALPHKASMDVVPAFLKSGKLVIDLSADYRLDADIYKIWYGIEHKDKANLPKAVYGLPELYHSKIKKAKFIANPGCYPTSIILGMAPMLDKGLADTGYIIVDSKSGVTGAGRKADLSISFSEANENMKAYKVNEHQHMPEIDMVLSDIAGHDVRINFTPHLVPMNRGILSTIYLKLNKKMGPEDVLKIYRDFYKDKPFVRICGEGKYPQIRDVANTNFCDIGIKVKSNVLTVVSCIDNLIKGASGQAVQNMNIMCGLSETEGLV